MLFNAILLVLGAFTAVTQAGYDSRIKTQLSLETPVNGVSTTPDGRVFLVYARVDGTQAQGLPEVVEWKNNTAIPYPDAAWNSYSPGKDPATHLVKANAQRIGPDGSLWIVDTGSPQFGEPVLLPQGPKIVKVNTTTNKVSRVYNMANAIFSDSLMDDLRFNKDNTKAYVSDAGHSALILLDLKTGDARRLLEGDPSLSPIIPFSAEGQFLVGVNGKPEYLGMDQLEVSPDGKWLHYQPASGRMSRILTQHVDAAFTNATLAAILSQFVEPYALTPNTGGTAIDAEGNIYASDTDRQAIEKIYPNGTRRKFLQDDRLLAVDAMWVDNQKRLWMPAPQLNRGVPFGNGKNNITKPLYIYTIDIGVGPSPIDHQ